MHGGCLHDVYRLRESEYNRGTGCGKTARPGLCRGLRVTEVPTAEVKDKLGKRQTVNKYQPKRKEFILNILLWLAIAITLYIAFMALNPSLPNSPFSDWLMNYAVCSPFWIIGLTQATWSFIAAIVCVEVVGRYWYGNIVRSQKYFAWLGVISLSLFTTSMSGVVLIRSKLIGICT